VVHDVRQLLKTAFNDWLDDRAPALAAALAYYTVFSLAPLLLIAIGIAGIVLGHEAAREGIMQQTAAILGPHGAETVDTLMGGTQTTRAGIAATVTGFVTLLVGAVGVLAQLKDALNLVWNVTPPATVSVWGFIRGYLANLALVVATGFLLLVSLIATAALGAATKALRYYVPGPDVLWVALDAGIGFVATAAVFALIFRTIPDADVRWRDVRVGAFITAALFTAGRIALGWYIGRQAGTSAYQAVGSVLALLAWVYYSSQLVLFGAEITHADAVRRGSA
jgi:membrane protein